ncbi:hypothetical protein Sjap_010750 [Stephania japonica]|uniref:Uncharacterized protein n=1 Tax=Stephania japonica TaxID=461633 RepID=A0AAP0JC63_9MAGN
MPSPTAKTITTMTSRTRSSSLTTSLSLGSLTRLGQIGCSNSINVDRKGDVLDCDHQRPNGSDGHCLWTQSLPVFLSVLCSVLGFLERKMSRLVQLFFVDS